MLNFFFTIFITFVRSKDSCDFEELPSVVNTMSSIAKPSRGLIGKFGIKTIDVYPGPSIFEDFGDSFMQYLLGCASLIVPFLLILIIFVLYFIVMCICCWCPCCRPKTSKKPSCIMSIIHLVSVALLIVSACLFLNSAINIAKGLRHVEKLPTSMSVTFNGIFSTINNIFDNVFNSIGGSVDDLEGNLRNFSTWMNKYSKANSNNAAKVIPSMVDYNNTFAVNTRPYYKSNATLYAALEASSIANKQALKAKLMAMGLSRQPGVDAVIDLASKLLTSTSDMDEAVGNIDSTIDGSLKDVADQIDKFKNSSLINSFDSFETSINSLVDMMKPVEKYMKLADKYIEPVIYAATAFLIAVAVLFGIVFFCRNCFSRSIVLLWPFFGFLLTVLIILPGVVFSLLFFVIYDICPDLENVAQSAMGQSDFGNISGLLLCEKEAPILDMIDFDFDYNSIIDDLAADAGSKLKAFKVPEGLIQNLGSYGEGFDVDRDISSEYIISNHTESLNLIMIATEGDAGMQENVKTMKEQIESKESALSNIRTLMHAVIDFGSEIVPSINETQNKTQNLVDSFSSESKVIIKDGIDNITCYSIRCVYSPVKNALCVNLMTGISFWLISSIFLTIGIAVMSISLCKRRRQMAKPQVRSATDSSDSDSSLSEFKRKKNKK